MDRWKVTALVLGGMVAGMVYGSACSLSASARGATGTRAVLYIYGPPIGSEGYKCPTGFVRVGRVPSAMGYGMVCLED